MNISEILEGISNKGRLIDILADNQTLAREIRQTYNKIEKQGVKEQHKQFIKNWASYTKTISAVQLNSQLVEMLDEIIKHCS